MSIVRICIRPASVLVATLCVALTACEPNEVPTLEQQSGSASMVAGKPQDTTLAASIPHELDVAARKATLTSAKLCNVEVVDGGKPGAEPTTVRDVSKVDFSGWVGDEATGRRPADARLRIVTLNNSRAWESDLGAPVVRKDVAKFVNVPTLEDAGFRATVDLSSLPQGEYRVYLVFNGPNGAVRCDNGRRVLR